LDYYANLSGDGYAAAVEDLISRKPIAGATPSLDQTLDPVNRLVGNLRGRLAVQPSLNEIQQTWVKKMLTTSTPLVERMTLFFHDHFATAFRPADNIDTPELETQNNLFRDNAIGNFRSLCHAMIEDVALSCWLDHDVNVKDHPNENLGREFFELFTLGVGNYTERDVRESARALTGYRLAYNFQGKDPVGEATGSRNVMVFDASRHDDGDKTILGQTGAWMPHDVVDIALLEGGQARAIAARFIAGKLAQSFVTAEPTAGYVDAIAAQLIANNWELAPALRFMFHSAEFTSGASRFALVKSPAEYVVGMLRALNKTSTDDCAIGVQWMTQAGQTLYNPPNVGGWPLNMGWLGASGVLARYNAAVQLADQHVSSSTLPGQTRLRSDSPVGWGNIFGVPDLAPQTVDSLNGYIAAATDAAATDPNAGSDKVVDAAMITLLVASPDYFCS
jgi:uncharacterized protein (DUF1800 family)